MSSDLSKAALPLSIGVVCAGIVGYFLGSRLASAKEEEDENFTKWVSELRSERDEVLQQILEKENYDVKNKLVTDFQSDKFTLLGADYCPFVQRVWIVLVEKKIPFDFIHVNLYNRSLTMTQRLLQVNPKGTVPAGEHNGQCFAESLDIMFYLEEAFPNHPLLPTEPTERLKLRTLLQKHSKIVGLFYKLLQAQDQIEFHAKNFSEALGSLNKDIVGPYSLGNQFSLLDAALIPFVARSEIIIAHYKKYKIPSEFTKVIEWVKNCTSRESYKATVQDRTEESMQVQPFHSKEYNSYLIELYESYAVNRTAEMKQALANTVKPLPKEKVREILYGEKKE